MAFVDKLKQKISHSPNDTWSPKEGILRAESYWIKFSQQQLVAIKEFQTLGSSLTIMDCGGVKGI